MALWIHSPTFTRALQECQQASFKAHKNADKLWIFCQEPTCWRLANFVRPQASLPRTTKDKPAYCCTPIINGKKIFLRTPKCHLQHSWACDPEDSKSKPIVRRRDCRANGEPSLVVGATSAEQCWAWCSNKAEAARQVKASSKPISIPMLGMSLPRLPFLVGTAVLPRRLKSFRYQWEMRLQETTCKNKVSFYRTSRYIVRNMPSTDVLRNKSKWIILLIAWNAIGRDVIANFVIK